jgi:hypothetical protein
MPPRVRPSRGFRPLHRPPLWNHPPAGLAGDQQHYLRPPLCPVQNGKGGELGTIARLLGQRRPWELHLMLIPQSQGAEHPRHSARYTLGPRLRFAAPEPPLWLTPPRAEVHGRRCDLRQHRGEPARRHAAGACRAGPGASPRWTACRSALSWFSPWPRAPRSAQSRMASSMLRRPGRWCRAMTSLDVGVNVKKSCRPAAGTSVRGHCQGEVRRRLQRS